MNPWYGIHNDKSIGEGIMAKVKCNHCKCKYSYKSAKGVSNLMEEVKLTAKLNIVELDRKFYCKGCRQTFAKDLIDDVFIIERAKLKGMRFPEEMPNWRDIQYKEPSTIMKFLERAGLVRKITIKK